jgi:outer membrane receptor protein involved in Fe transport
MATATSFQKVRVLRLTVLAVGLLLLLPPSVWAQAFVNGTIVGTVTDNSGGVVPEAGMTLTNLGTNAIHTAKTDETGLYQFVNVPPGRYRIEAERSGFQRSSREPVVVEVNSSLKIDLTLQVGATSQTVTVAAETPLLQTQSSSLGEVVGSRSVNELPLNGRNPMALVALVPGVVPQGQSGQNMVTLNPFGAGNFQINGGQANQSAAYWDGAPLNSIGYLNVQALIPTQDALQEFKVMTDNLPTEYDRFAGGIVSFTTKTGTNQIHGEAYEYLRNKVLNANNFFNNASGLAVPAFTQNQFGGNFGGPVVIPHLYNGRDKTFFFASYDGFRLREGLPLLFTVPTLSERAGNFTDYRDGNGNLIPIYDPASTVFNPATQQYTRTQISCNGALNVICPANLDPTAKILTNLWGAPNLPGQQPGNVNNWAGNASEGGDMNQFTIRVDQNISDKQRFFTRYTINKWDNLPIDPFHTDTYPLTIGTPENYTIQQAVVDDSYSFSPTTILDVELAWLHEGYSRTPGSLGFDLSQLGPGWAPLNDQVSFRTLPVLGVTGITDFSSQETGSVIRDHTDDWVFRPNLTMIRGRHTLKFGWDFWVSRFNFAQDNVASGVFSFNPAFTAAGPFTSVGGSGFASFMLGAAASGSAESVNFIASQLIYNAFYVQDNFQVNRKLTLNLGLRYDLEGAFTERFNRISTFLPNLTSPLAQPTGLPLHGAFALVDTPQRPGRSGYNMSLTHFAPRFGLAYQVTPTTVLRGGYGIFWLPTLSAGADNPSSDPVDFFTTPMINTVNGGITPYNLLSNPFPSGIIPAPGRDPSFQSLLLGESVGMQVPTNPYYGYVQQWNLDLQKQLPGNVFVDVAYAGSRGVHLPFIGQFNQLPVQDMSMGNSLFNSVPNPFYGLVPSISPLATPTVPAGQLLLPYPQYLGLAPTQNAFQSRYNSMQMKVRKNFSGGQSILVSYTIAKLITNTDTLTGWLEPGGSTEWALQNYYNLKGEESLATFDVPQRLVASYVLELPVGKGKKYLNSSTGPASRLVSGWGVEGTTTFQRGFPLFLGTASNLTGSFNGGSRPNFDTSACPNGAALGGSAETRLNMWFNTNCFVQPPAFTFGTVSRTLPNVRTDGLSNFDFAIFKNSTFGTESRLGLQFRAEFFNLFNTPQFGYPGQTVGTPQFGIVSSQVNNPRLIQFGLKFMF